MNDTRKHSDSSQRFLFDGTDIRGELARLNSSYTQTVRGHGYPEAVQRLLGEFLAATVLLASTIKYEGRLVLQARGGESLRGESLISLVMAECTSEGDVRGIVRYDTPPQTDDFRALLGDGTLAITVDSRKGEPYQGIVALHGDSLADCLEQYFTQSEQLATRFFIAADDSQVTALLLQQLPASEQKDSNVRTEQWQHISTLARTVRADELLSLDNDTLLHRLYHQESVRLFDPKSLRYQCSCSRERTAGALLAIGAEEVESILAEQGDVSMTCEFCGTHYSFTEGEVRLLLTERGSTLTH